MTEGRCVSYNHPYSDATVQPWIYLFGYCSAADCRLQQQQQADEHSLVPVPISSTSQSHLAIMHRQVGAPSQT